MNKRSINPVNPLLCMNVRIEHYVELRITDKYTTPIFQYRLGQHFSSPWKEPRKSIKTKLILTYTSVILKNASWWPYRQINSIDYKSIHKFITFNQENLRFAIGIYDEDFAEKQYIVMSTKQFSNVEKLIQLIHSQLLIWKHSLKDEMDQIKINKKSINSLKSIDKSYSLNDINEQRSGNKTLKGYNNDSNNRQKARKLEDHSRHRDSHRDKQKSHHTYTNLDDNISIDARTTSAIQSTSNNCHCGNKGHKVKTIKKQNEIRSDHKNCQTDTEYYYCPHEEHDLYAAYPFESDQKSWEVDIKHIRYDPVLGNILDDNGSVYLYTAHEIG